MHDFRVDAYGAPPYPELVLVTARSTLREDPALVHATVRALVRGYGVTVHDPASSLNDLESRVHGLDAGQLQTQLDVLIPALSPPGRPHRRPRSAGARPLGDVGGAIRDRRDAARRQPSVRHAASCRTRARRATTRPEARHTHRTGTPFGARARNVHAPEGIRLDSVTPCAPFRRRCERACRRFARSSPGGALKIQQIVTLAATAVLATAGALAVPSAANAAAAPVFDAATDTLTVTGDDPAGENIVLTDDGAHIVVTAGGTSTTTAAPSDATLTIVVRGFSGPDKLDASALPATAYGSLTLDGAGGDDVLAGGAGRDRLIGGGGQDGLIGGAGDDTLDGGDDQDALVWNDGDGSDSDDGGAGDDLLNVNGDPVGADALTLAPDGGGLRFARANLMPFAIDVAGVESVAVAMLGGDDVLTVDPAVATQVVADGGDGDDIITTGAGDDVIGGGAGDDAIDAAAGDDTIDASADVDTLDGGAGEDTISVIGDDAGGDALALTPSGTRLRLARTNLTPFTALVANAETVNVASLGGADLVTANPAVTVHLIVNGGDGDDTVTTGGGDDTLTVSPGDDTLDGGAGDDAILVAGDNAGGDALTLTPNGTGLRLARTNLAPFTARVANAESVFASLRGGDDRLVVDPAITTPVTANGGDGNDALDGGAGDDRLGGGGGPDDALNGGAGDDRLSGGGGAHDTLDGGAGDDTISVTGDDAGGGDALTLAPNGPMLRLTRANLTPFALDIANAETISISTFGGDDTLAVDPVVRTRLIADGGAGNDTLAGGAGNDTLDGATGDDTLLARDGAADTVHGGDGHDRAVTDAITVDAVDGVESLDVPAAPDTTAQLPTLGRFEVVRRHGKLIARATIGCPVTEAGGCDATVALTTARRVRIGRTRKLLTLGTRRIALAGAKQTTIAIPLRGSIRRYARRGKVAARVRTATRDAAGNRAARTVRVTLKLPRARR